MIRAEMVLEDGLLRSLEIKGHSGAAPKGSDIVCAAVSVLSGTVYKVLSGRDGISVEAVAPERGEFRLELKNYESFQKDFLFGVTAFLKEGLLSVSGEYPDHCRLNVKV